MGSIQSWAFAVCVTMVGAAIFSMLVPNSNLKKVVTFTISLFFLSSLLSPFLFKIPQLDFSVVTEEVTQNEELTEGVEQEILVQTQQMLEGQLQYLFTQNGYKIENIAIDMNRTTSKSDQEPTISIDLTLALSEVEHEDEIVTLTKSLVGVTPQITYS